MTEQKIKRVYQKPEIRQVRLTPEEAVLAACKVAGAARRAGGKCDNSRGGCINNQQGS